MYDHTTIKEKNSCSLQPTCIYLTTSISINQLDIAKHTTHHRYILIYLYLKNKCRKKPKTIGDTKIKLRSQTEFHKPEDRSSSIYGTVTVLTKEDCLSNLIALLYPVEGLPINLSFFKSCRKDRRKYSFLARVKNMQIQAACSFSTELTLVLL